MQEAARKDVERAFGVLQARFAIVQGPARIWDLETLSNIMKACIIMHNMIIEDEGGSCDLEFDGTNAQPPESLSHGGSDAVDELFERLHRIRSSETHSQLQIDLAQHLWDLHGN